MRWRGQQVLDDGVGDTAALPGLRGLLRSVRPPEFAGMVFHEVEARSALNRVPDASPVPFRWTVNPYRGCGHACTYCTVGSTPVLCGDGRPRPIAELRVGDVVVGTEVVGGVRRYVRTPVLAHWSTVRPAHRVTLADGTRLVTSGEHRFLTERGWRHVTPGWCAAGRRPWLKPGIGLVGPGGPRRLPAADEGPVGATGDAAEESLDGPAYRAGYLTGLVRADEDGLERQGPGGPDGPTSGGEARPYGGHRQGAPGAHQSGDDRADRCFPSERLELEVLGRAHHYLAARAVPAPGAGTGIAVADPFHPLRASVSPGGGTARVGPPDDAWPLHPDDGWCAGFLAGVVDARGAVTDGMLRIELVDEEIIGRVAGALHRLGFPFGLRRRPARPGGGGRHGVCVVEVGGGPSMLLSFLRRVDPASGSRRDLSGAPVEGGPGLRVTAVEALGVELPMYDITTGTGDFVAGGVVHHNCFARNTHTYLDLDAGADFDRQIVVKVNVARVLERELRAPRWRGEPVAMGTNTDPYQRAEGRYRLMPGVIAALARSGTPFSLLTKGTVLSRDLPQLASAAADVPVGLGVSIALLDRPLQARLEPGTPSPQARLDLVRRIVDAGLECGVMVAPVLPLLTDSAEALDALLERIAAAGASGVSVLALHLRPGTREWFLAWLAREHPRLVAPYARLYRRGAYVDPEYRRALARRVAPLVRRHGLGARVATLREQELPAPDPAPRAVEQLSLL
ncbi:MAG: intein-containing Rv2578c family radical SAM protein [Pseudonocardia sp.]